ncbi:MAG: DNA translocase FtsK 4TM domain-containing protein [Gammaproteobacteria bacterium]|nr:DNA translocase FtsK 4TM domain-containing protein [Gammaproteobacteria bacterium]
MKQLPTNPLRRLSVRGNKKTTPKRTARRPAKPKSGRATGQQLQLPEWLLDGLKRGLGLLSLVVAAYLTAALVTYHPMDPGYSFATTVDGTIHNAGGRVGAWFADWILVMAGYAAYAVPAGLFALGYATIVSEIRGKTLELDFIVVRLSLVFAFATCIAILMSLHAPNWTAGLPEGVMPGGLLGGYLGGLIVPFVGWAGVTLGCGLAVLILGCALIGVSPIALLDITGAMSVRVFNWLSELVVNSLIWMGKHRPLEVAEQLIQKRREEATEVGGVPTLNDRVKKTAEPESMVKDLNSTVPFLPAAEPLAEDDFDAPFLGSSRSFVPPLDAAVDEPELPLASPRAIEPAVQKMTPDFFDAPVIAPSPLAEAIKPQQATKKDLKPHAPTVKILPVEERLPSIDLLDQPKPPKTFYSQAQLDHLSRLLEQRFADFNVTVQVVEVNPGPVIVRFELQPAPGVKSAQIANLSKDIARSLGVMAVRVVEVIPGKTTVGIEIPNENREIVQLSEIFMSESFQGNASPLTLALGKDIAGRPVCANLAKMPHLLVAGTTGSGKSVGVNSMLMSLLYKATADDVRLILIDPKMLELSVYEGIPHLLAPVVTDMNEAANALRWSVGEMERRYKLMSSLGVRNLAGYNRKIEDAQASGEYLVDPLYDPAKSADPSGPPPQLEKMPHIVIVIDEFADMMMVVGKKCEELIARIAQKARAAGIHLILATQRPSVDVITGLIKANIPTRIAFQVSSKIDSRTILDQMGAETLLGHGDMLYLPPGTANPERVHGAFVDDHEVHAVVDFLKQDFEPQYLNEILSDSTPIPGIPGEAGAENPEGDALYDQAVAIVTESRKASISYVQRRLKIGYNRAARMIEDMEAAGVVSGVGPNGQREVLAPPPV